MAWLANHLPERPARGFQRALEWMMWGGFYVWELALLSFAILAAVAVPVGDGVPVAVSVGVGVRVWDAVGVVERAAVQ